MALPVRELELLKVASPCHAAWEQMQGTDKVRLCGECGLNVYNLSAMSRAEAESLVRQREGRLCVRFYRRPDGTLLTEDCPRAGRAAARRRARGRAPDTQSIGRGGPAPGARHRIGRAFHAGDSDPREGSFPEPVALEQVSRAARVHGQALPRRAASQGTPALAAAEQRFHSGRHLTWSQTHARMLCMINWFAKEGPWTATRPAAPWK
jgi:hypothetical protein